VRPSRQKTDEKLPEPAVRSVNGYPFGYLFGYLNVHPYGYLLDIYMIVFEIMDMLDIH
jgi:hypothetical protein